MTHPAIAWLEEQYYRFIELKEKLADWNEEHGDIPLLVACMVIVAGFVSILMLLERA